jgi:hypothetical protein
VLVAAVLAPEKREDRELEVVWVATEERPDTVELPVGQTECTVDGLVRDGAQRTTTPFRKLLRESAYRAVLKSEWSSPEARS